MSSGKFRLYSRRAPTYAGALGSTLKPERSYGDTVVLALVLEVLVLSVTSAAEMVKLPAALNVTLNEPVPLASGASAASVAAASLLVR